MVDDITPQSFRVPRDNRSVLSIPRMDAVPALIDKNRALFATTASSIHGRRLLELRSDARQQVLQAAQAFTSAITQTQLPAATVAPLIVTGHQPELFHVGVWAKNFATAGIARRSQSMALNLIIDNDTMNSTSIKVPAGTRDVMRIEQVLFDTPRPTQPWEEATINDRAMFQQFGPVIQERIREAWGFEALIGSAWTAAVAQMSQSNRLCDALTALRIHCERQWGQNNLELPMSWLCQTESFLWFVSDLLFRLPQFHAIYNEAVARYRREHRLRNNKQPVPDLARTGDWFEAPFWIWRQGDFQRGRLFARLAGSFCELRNEDEIFAKLPMTDDGPLDPVIEMLRELPARGYRLRSRALTTTLFARVYLADLFVHGIGGAKYDAMTDEICERFFGLPAPKFLTVSATLHLPLGDAFSTTEAQLREINHQLRDLRYNPERHLQDSPQLDALIAEKTELLQSAQALRQSNQLRGKLAPAQHRQLEEIRRKLQSLTGELQTEYEAKRAAMRAQLATNSLIKNREYSFVLYPADYVRDFLRPLAQSEQSVD